MTFPLLTLRLRARFGPGATGWAAGRTRFSPGLALPSTLIHFQLCKRVPNSALQDPKKASRIGRPDSGRRFLVAQNLGDACKALAEPMEKT